MPAETGATKASVEGIVRWMRSTGEGADRCPCCEGPHVFCRYLDLDHPPGTPEPAGKRLDDWVHRFAESRPQEGARVRITVEVLLDAAEDGPSRPPAPTDLVALLEEWIEGDGCAAGEPETCGDCLYCRTIEVLRP